MARQPGRGQRLSEPVQTPGQPAMPGRSGQRIGVHLRLPRLGLRQRRETAGGAQHGRRLLRRTGDRPVGVDAGGPTRQLQGAVLRHFRSLSPVATGLPRFDDMVLGHLLRPAGGRNRGDGRRPQVGGALQLEVPGGELRRGCLPRWLDAPFGRPGGVQRRGYGQPHGGAGR